MSALEFIGLEKRFGHTTVLTGVNLAIRTGEFVVLLGSSGCGKSTLLRLLSGLEDPTAGDIRLAGESILAKPPQDRGVAMVFQSYALYPHLTVRENLAFPLIVRGVKDAANAEIVGQVAHTLGLSELLDRLPKQLSGGQRQRVAIGRCLVRRPEIYLFDEPLSNLDAALRSRMRVELKALHAKIGKTMIYVTHDQVEAMTLADRVVILDKGVVQQVGSPREVYETPANKFVATFVGTPTMNLIDGDVRNGVFHTKPDADATATAHPPQPIVALGMADRSVTLGIRPEDVELVTDDDGDGEAAGNPDAPILPATVRLVEPVGERGYLHVEMAHQSLVASISGAAAFDLAPGAVVKLRLRPDRLHVFDAHTTARVPHHSAPSSDAPAPTPAA